MKLKSKQKTKANEAPILSYYPSVTNASAHSLFVESLPDDDDLGANEQSHLRAFLVTIKYILECGRYRSFTFSDLLRDSRHLGFEVPPTKLKELLESWCAKMLSLQKISVIPPLVADEPVIVLH